MFFNGFIKIQRKILNWEWYTCANTFRLFMHCLLKANHAKAKWRGVSIPAGNFVTSISKLSSELGLTEKQTRGALERLQRTGEIAYKGTSQYSIITVKNWSLYQVEGQAKGQAEGKQKDTQKGKQKGNQGANEGQAEGKQRATNKKNKNEKKNKNKEIKILFHKILNEVEEFKEYQHLAPVFETWLDYKQEIKDQYKGEIGVENAFKKLISLSGGNFEKAQDVVRNCAANNWKGLYATKGSKQGNVPAAQTGAPVVDYESRSRD